jgi:hypothetical protein
MVGSQKEFPTADGAVENGLKPLPVAGPSRARTSILPDESAHHSDGSPSVVLLFLGKGIRSELLVVPGFHNRMRNGEK